MKRRFQFAFASIIVIYLLMNVYIGWHGLVLLSYLDIAISPYVYWPVFIFITLSFIIGRMPFLKGVTGVVVKVIGSYYLFVFEFMIIVLPLAHVLTWVLGYFSYDPQFYVPTIGLAILVLLIFAAARGSWNAWTPTVRKHEIVIDKPAGELKELRIVMASDFHLGNIVGKRHLRKFIKYTESMNPDLILLAGDIIDDSIEPFKRHRMDKLLEKLKARFGVYAVLGNHEYYGKHTQQFVEEMAKINIPVLQDDVVLVENLFYVAGRKDKTANNMDPEGRLSTAVLLEEIDKNKPIIMMDHQPTDYGLAEEAGVDLILSGHTHRGQFFPNQYITRKLFELDWGYLLKNNMHAIVSSGFGTWGPPFRLGSRSEIVEIIIRFP